MKAPFVSRKTYEAVVARLAQLELTTVPREALERAQELLTTQQQQGWAAMQRAQESERRYNDLFALCAELIKPKAELIAPVPQVLQPREPSMVVQTIRELANGDQRMMQYLHQRKRELRKEHPTMTDDALCAELSTWQTSEELFEVAP